MDNSKWLIKSCPRLIYVQLPMFVNKVQSEIISTLSQWYGCIHNSLKPRLGGSSIMTLG